MMETILPELLNFLWFRAIPRLSFKEPFMSDRPAKLRRIFLILLILLAVTAGTELALRGTLGLGNPVLITRDAACDFTLKPDQELRRFFCRTHINHYAMRSEEIAPNPAPGVERILFIGDSVTYGTTRVDQSDLFTERLARALPQQIHRPVEVLNASASAWAIDNELSYVRSRGTFHAQLVVLVLNSGDLSQPRARIDDVSDALAREKPAGALAELWNRTLKRKLFPRVAAAHNDAGTAANLNDEQEIRANLARLDRLQALVSNQQGRLIVVYIPFWHDLATSNAPQRARLGAWAKEKDIPFLDFTEIEAAHPAREITLDTTHLNAAGHRLIAEEFVRQLPGILAQK